MHLGTEVPWRLIDCRSSSQLSADAKVEELDVLVKCDGKGEHDAGELYVMIEFGERGKRKAGADY